jgi:predicted TPR repeat methyltransferase
MSNGWDQSAEAWIASLGDRGDWGREHILDPAMLTRIDTQHFKRALDLGCGEGRFCRMLKARGISIVGIDPSQPLLNTAMARGGGSGRRGGAGLGDGCRARQQRHDPVTCRDMARKIVLFAGAGAV